MSDSVVLERFRRQLGVVTRAQAMADGLTPRQITRRVRTGTWNRVGPGIYRHPAVDPTWRAELLIACFRLDGLASHRSAAVLHGFPGHEPGPIEVTVRRGRRRDVGCVVVHESTALDRAAPVLTGPIWCTGVARTVFDLAGSVSRAELKRTITFVVDTKRASWGDLYSVLVDHCAKGRDGCGPMRSALEELCGESSLSHTAQLQRTRH